MKRVSEFTKNIDMIYYSKIINIKEAHFNKFV